MGELFTQTASFGAAFPRWLNRLGTLPGMRAVRLPKFGSDAITCAGLAVFYALLLRGGEAGYFGAWVLFVLLCLPSLLMALIFLPPTFRYMACRLRKQPLAPDDLPLQAWLFKASAVLPNLMLFVWAVVHLSGNHALWLNRAALLIWLNYFAVGCAVALRRGVDDFFRSRNAKREKLSITR